VTTDRPARRPRPTSRRQSRGRRAGRGGWSVRAASLGRASRRLRSGGEFGPAIGASRQRRACSAACGIARLVSSSAIHQGDRDRSRQAAPAAFAHWGSRAARRCGRSGGARGAASHVTSRRQGSIPGSPSATGRSRRRVCFLAQLAGADIGSRSTIAPNRHGSPRGSRRARLSRRGGITARFARVEGKIGAADPSRESRRAVVVPAC